MRRLAEPGAPQRRRELPGEPPASPFAFDAILEARRRAELWPRPRRAPAARAPEAPDWLDPIEAELMLCAELRERIAELDPEASARRRELERLEAAAAFDAELDRELAEEAPRPFRSRWVDRTRKVHWCARCKGDINPTERARCDAIKTASGVRSVYVCEGCASPGAQSIAGRAIDRYGNKAWRESGEDYGEVY